MTSMLDINSEVFIGFYGKVAFHGSWHCELRERASHSPRMDPGAAPPSRRRLAPEYQLDRAGPLYAQPDFGAHLRQGLWMFHRSDLSIAKSKSAIAKRRAIAKRKSATAERNWRTKMNLPADLLTKVPIV